MLKILKIKIENPVDEYSNKLGTAGGKKTLLSGEVRQKKLQRERTQTNECNVPKKGMDNTVKRANTFNSFCRWKGENMEETIFKKIITMNFLKPIKEIIHIFKTFKCEKCYIRHTYIYHSKSSGNQV